MRWTNWMMAASVACAAAPVLAQFENPRTTAGDVEQIVVQQQGQVIELPPAALAQLRELPQFAQTTAPSGAPMVVGGDIRFIRAPRAMEKGTYLGLAASRVPQALRAQLGLAQGVGLVVDFVEPDSPAQAAGIKPFDVLQKLDDQILINSDQLQTLVRTCKPAQEVRITLVREGKPQTLTAKLVEHDVPALADGERLQLLGGMVEAELTPGPDRLVLPRIATEKATAQAFVDKDKMIFITRKDGPEGKQASLVVKDKDGKVIFEAPVATPAEQEKLPAEYRAALARMNAVRAELQPATRPAREIDPALRKALEKTLPEIRFDEVALSDVIDFLRDVTGTNFTANWRTLEPLKVTRTKPVSLRLREVSFEKVLDLLASELGDEVIWTADRGVITFTSADDPTLRPRQR